MNEFTKLLPEDDDAALVRSYLKHHKDPGLNEYGVLAIYYYLKCTCTEAEAVKDFVNLSSEMIEDAKNRKTKNMAGYGGSKPKPRPKPRPKG